MIIYDYKKRHHVVPEHAPGADLDYGFVLTNWLEVGETIASATWEVITSTTDITLSRQQISGAIISTFITGGVVDCDYIVKVTFTTNQDRTDSRIIELHCRYR